MTLRAEWIDSGREPRCAPDPKYPNGLDVDTSDGAARTCSIDLPYPAKRCGTYIIRCDVCGIADGITTAGRRDDPRRVTVPCYAHVLDPHPGATEVVLPDTPKMKRTPHI